MPFCQQFWSTKFLDIYHNIKICYVPQDTAGHERYESMTRMYYRGAAACILCYDITDRTSFDRVRFWAGELKATEQVSIGYMASDEKEIQKF